MFEPNRKPRRVLAAITPDAFPSLSGQFEVIFRTSFAMAEAPLNDSIDIIIGGIHFDECQMFRLLRLCKSPGRPRESSSRETHRVRAWPSLDIRGGKPHMTGNSCPFRLCTPCLQFTGCPIQWALLPTKLPRPSKAPPGFRRLGSAFGMFQTFQKALPGLQTYIPLAILRSAVRKDSARFAACKRQFECIGVNHEICAPNYGNNPGSGKN